MTAGQADLPDLTTRVQAQLLARGETVAVAESLTGGLLGAALTDRPGASQVFRGGVISYSADLKVALLGVDPSVLAAHGAVCADVAAAMAVGVRQRLGATYGLATTGAAGPDRSDDSEVGTVFVAVSGPVDGDRVQRLLLGGGRGAVRAGAVTAVLRLLGQVLAEAGNASG